MAGVVRKGHVPRPDHLLRDEQLRGNAQRGSCQSAQPGVGVVGVVALMPRQVHRCRGQFDREGEQDQAEVGDRGPRGGFGDADHEIGTARELQRGRFRWHGRHHAAGEAELREGVVEGIAEVSTSRDGDVLSVGVPLCGDGPDAREGCPCLTTMTRRVSPTFSARMSGALGRLAFASRSTSPRRNSGVSMLDSATKRRRTPGACPRTAASSAGPLRATRESCQRSVKVRSSVARSSSRLGASTPGPGAAARAPAPGRRSHTASGSSCGRCAPGSDPRSCAGFGPDSGSSRVR